jgi:hypothetical protein
VACAGPHSGGGWAGAAPVTRPQRSPWLRPRPGPPGPRWSGGTGPADGRARLPQGRTLVRVLTNFCDAANNQHRHAGDWFRLEAVAHDLIRERSRPLCPQGARRPS